MGVFLNNNITANNFMQENKLIYAFQKNIVKNAKYTKYYEWFEFAERSLKKDNTEADFEKYNNRDVFLEMMHRLKAGTNDQRRCRPNCAIQRVYPHRRRFGRSH
jgi:hypothetical protein